ncbi:hypothetical protein MK489_18360 [Myxococcota bacterium]|nr:hypothetical protein [Myxococcota bacterium]
MNGLRRAALCLHGLADQDRSWLLDQLEPEQRTKLEPLLQELSELNPPAEVAQLEFEEETVSTPTDREKWIRTIDRAEPSVIRTLLASEPNCVIVSLLSNQSWAWLENFLDSLPLHQRNEITEQIALSNGSQPPLLSNAILETMSTRITEHRSNANGFQGILDREISGVVRRRFVRWSESWAR